MRVMAKCFQLHFLQNACVWVMMALGHLCHIVSWKPAYIILTPFKTPLLYSKTGVYRGIHYFSYFCSKNIDCVYSLELPHRRGSNEYPQSMFLSKNVKNIRVFYLKIFSFFEVKFSIYLNRGVFVMTHFWFLLFLQFHSCSFPVPLFHCLYYLFYPFSPLLWETVQNDPQGLMFG